MLAEWTTLSSPVRGPRSSAAAGASIACPPLALRPLDRRVHRDLRLDLGAGHPAQARRRLRPPHRLAGGPRSAGDDRVAGLHDPRRLRGRPPHADPRSLVSGAGAPGALARSLVSGPVQTLSANSVNAYVRPIRSLAIWLVDEGILAVNPFRRSTTTGRAQPPATIRRDPDQERDTRGSACSRTRLCRRRSPRSARWRHRLDPGHHGCPQLKRPAAAHRRCRLRAGGHPLPAGQGRQDSRTRPAARDSDRSVCLPRARTSRLPACLPYSLGDPGWLFLSHAGGEPRPLTMNALSLMLTRRYHAGGGSLRCFGSHRIRHATATLLVNNGMPLEEVSRYLGHSSTVTDPTLCPPDAGGSRNPGRGCARASGVDRGLTTMWSGVRRFRHPRPEARQVAIPMAQSPLDCGSPIANDVLRLLPRTPVRPHRTRRRCLGRSPARWVGDQERIRHGER